MPFHRLLLAISTVFLLVGASLAQTRCNVVLITLDTTRADRMGFLGSEKKLTPNLDAFAKDSVVFLHAYSQAPLTTTSHASILTGTYPQFHNVSQAGVSLRPDLPYGPAILRGAGYRTGAFVGALILQARGGGAPGFDRGFDEYDAGFHRLQPGEDRYATVERRAGEVITRALHWISNTNRPFLVWIHLYDPHAPYEPPQPFASHFKFHAYDGEIAYVDSVLGTFFANLRKHNLYEKSLIVVVADHGEALGEHGERGHGLFLYDTTIHVPLLFKLPMNREAGKQIRTRVELVDILPTILAIVGQKIPSAVQGRSLLPLLHQGIRNTPVSFGKAYAETDYPHAAFGWSSLRALRQERYLFIQAPRPELYDESSDPSEERNLASSLTAVSSTLNTELTDFRERTRGSDRVTTINLDPEQESALRSLGYISSTNGARKVVAQGTDPKDKVALSNEMTDIAFVLEEGRYKEAIARLNAVLEQDPKLLPAYKMLLLAWTKLGDRRNALQVLQQMTKQFPDRPLVHLQLAMALIQGGDLSAAEPELKLAVEGMPKSAEAHFQLAKLYLNLHKMAEAKEMALEACALQPGHYEANLMLGYIYLAEQQPGAAVPYLLRASETQPDASKPHEFLARAYAIMGANDLAQHERARAEALTGSSQK